MPRLGLRTQLLAITLMLVDAFQDLQEGVQGYRPEGCSLGSLLVVVGLFVAGLGLLGPTLAGGTGESV